MTIAGGDIPLADAFALDETFRPSDQNRPMVLPEYGPVGIDAQAIGTPFPTGKIFRHAQEVLHNVRPSGSWQSGPSLHDEGDVVVTSYNWVYEFQVQHPSYHEIRLDRGQWWRLLYDWHGVMNDGIVRHRILSESWAISLVRQTDAISRKVPTRASHHATEFVVERRSRSPITMPLCSGLCARYAVIATKGNGQSIAARLSRR